MIRPRISPGKKIVCGSGRVGSSAATRPARPDPPAVSVRACSDCAHADPDRVGWRAASALSRAFAPRHHPEPPAGSRDLRRRGLRGRRGRRHRGGVRLVPRGRFRARVMTRELHRHRPASSASLMVALPRRAFRMPPLRASGILISTRPRRRENERRIMPFGRKRSPAALQAHPDAGSRQPPPRRPRTPAPPRCAPALRRARRETPAPP